MRIRLFFAAVAVILLAGVPVCIFAARFHLAAMAVLRWAGDAVHSARGSADASYLSVRVATNSSRLSESAAEQSLQMTGNVLRLLETLVLQVHSRAMQGMANAVGRRLDAAEHAVDALQKAWEKGFLGSCSQAGGTELTPAPFAMQFAEQAQSFPPYFKYIYYDEPHPTVEGELMDCGWGSSANYTFYAMGGDLRYVYWGNDPTVDPQRVLWKDTEASSNTYSETEMTSLLSEGAAWDSYVFQDVIDGVALPAGLLYSRWMATKRGEKLAGIFGADMDMEFLSSALLQSLLSSTSSAFIFDLTSIVDLTQGGNLTSSS